MLYDAVDRREAEPCALAGLLGGEERLEDPSLRLRVHPGTGVRHGQHDVATRLGNGVAPHVGFVHLDVRRLDNEVSPLRHGVARVDREVHDDLLELPRVDLHLAQVPGERRGEPHVGPQEPREQLLGTRQYFVDVEHLRLEHLLAAEREQLPRQRARSLGGLADLLDVFPLRLAGGAVLEQQLAVAQDHRQEIIEIVRHASRQPPHRLHLLCLDQLLLELALVRHIAHERFVVVDRACGRPDGADAQLHRDAPAILPLPGRLHLVVLAIGVGVAIEQPLPLRGIGIHVARHVESQQLGGRVIAQDARQRGVG